MSLTSLHLTKPSSSHPKQHLPSITRLCGVGVFFPSWAEHVSSGRAHTPKHRRGWETRLFGCTWFHQFLATLKSFQPETAPYSRGVAFQCHWTQNACSSSESHFLQLWSSLAPLERWACFRSPGLWPKQSVSEREVLPEQLNLALVIIPGSSCTPIKQGFEFPNDFCKIFTFNLF